MKKWFAVIGDPIAQSMSPDMHSHWFAKNGLDAVYIPVHVTADRLEQAVRSLRELGCSGWNVTVPHKSAIIEYLDDIDPYARKMGAVNTVRVMEDGSLFGMNTDGIGFVRSLEEQFAESGKGQEVLLIGAGGAARGIGYALVSEGYGPITCVNRTYAKAERLAGELHAGTMPIEDAAEQIAKFGLIIQTTSVGMNFAENGMPLDPARIKPETVVCDIIYNPLETQFLEQARKAGGLTMNGVGMFVHQGARSFESWTGMEPDTKQMIETITKKLGGI
ncbi:shikimate dehydrogenase [Sporosarcina luteola]|nr:shikimate dehydrogenase [Sporosarcina luteola]